MKPKHFILLAIAAIVTSLLALTSWALNDTWSKGTLAGTRLFPSLANDAGKVAAIEIKQGATTVTLQKTGNGWSIKERGGYPAEADKVRALMLPLAQADLVEAKTRKPERYALLEVEDPASKDAKSRSVRALDAKGSPIAEVIVGKRRSDAFGAGRGATYVRRPGDVQSWMASGEIDAPMLMCDWMKPQVFYTESAQIDKVVLEVQGEEPLTVERTKDADAKVSFVGFPPEGKKLKDTYAAESLVRAASSIELEDVRKAAPPAPDGKDTSKFSFETAGGLKVTYTIRKELPYYWLAISATGEGDAKKLADELNARVGGWEFNISGGKAESLLKRRAELIDDKAS